jgi:glycosyltransferase involved in cell wall biosynthesis
MPETVVIVSAYQEEDVLPTTLRAVREAFPGARVLVADDGSGDGTPHVALQAGAELVRSPTTVGKGGAMTLAAERVMALALEPGAPVFVLCDGDLGESAARLAPLARAVRDGELDLAIARFRVKVGGGFGAAVGFSRWATRRLGGPELAAPISGQRALRPEVLAAVLPFAPGFGMETAMTIDAHRAGFRLVEVELPLEHRATGRTPRGFLHRARQLASFARVYVSRR